MSRISTWLDSFKDAEVEAAKLRRTEVDYCQLLLQELHQRLDNGDATPPILGDLFRGLPEPLTHKKTAPVHDHSRWLRDATGTTLVWLTGKLAMLPEMQDKAYYTIKAIYGDQLPDLHDMDRVEYIKALGMEAGRFWTPIRLGFSRETFKDCVVDGIHIPEGTLVVCNSFRINRDPERYDSPEEFSPERWMNGHYGRTDTFEEQMPKIGVPHLGHGVGQRMCMGIAATNKTLYGVLVLLLYFFKIERAPLTHEAQTEVFPLFRAMREASLGMHPIDDQISTCDAQALPGYVGTKLTPRDLEALTLWLVENDPHELGTN